MKQVYLARWNQWANVIMEDDEWLFAIDPVDGSTTMVDKSYEYHVRPVDMPESYGEPH
jgi:hypothetical protein